MTQHLGTKQLEAYPSASSCCDFVLASSTRVIDHERRPQPPDWQDRGTHVMPTIATSRMVYFVVSIYTT